MNTVVTRVESTPSGAGRLFKGEKVWVFGTGSFGRAVARACLLHDIDVQGFVQTEPRSREVDELPVRSWGELDAASREMPLLIGIFNRDTPIDALVRLAEGAGFRNILLPWDFYGQFSSELGWRYWLADPDLLRCHSGDVARVSERLADDASRECLRRVVRFRMGIDHEYAGFAHPETQYFNEITLSTLRGGGVRYLDGGAYDGDSFRALLAKTQVASAWLFEPDPQNFSMLTRRIREGTDLKVPCTCLPLGLGDGYRMLRFSGGAGEAGHLDENGTDGIMTVAIDDLLHGQDVDFIKLDIEGGEAMALIGAKETLIRHRPVMAVSSYHQPHDLWALPDLIDDIAPSYKFYFRQHASNSFDLVLYAVP